MILLNFYWSASEFTGLLFHNARWQSFEYDLGNYLSTAPKTPISDSDRHFKLIRSSSDTMDLPSEKRYKERGIGQTQRGGVSGIIDTAYMKTEGSGATRARTQILKQ